MLQFDFSQPKPLSDFHGPKPLPLRWPPLNQVFYFGHLRWLRIPTKLPVVQQKVEITTSFSAHPKLQTTQLNRPKPYPP